ncbi:MULTISPECIES: hypothetical protein [unclassified Streptomyces]|uniref:hypothetical protein n=1 Tax=unclassified Streptomyces TaxID=2593676 RepID=UPI002E2D8DCC|nr:hypothetical protein [Streptomyces sp. NBC_00223]
MSRGIPSWAVVSGLTAAAMVGVSVLALQASGVPAKPPVAAPTPRPTMTHPHTPPPPPAVPAHSGTGKRIVYSLGQHRVWVVPPTGKITTFPVQAGTVPAKIGTHYVTGRHPTGVGGDGVAVEHIVYFEYTAETWVAFSAPVSDKIAAPDPSLHTGALRVHRDAATAIWKNTVNGSTVVVVH